MPWAFIIVLNWNNLKDTAECLESFGKIDCPACHVLVVDNGSTDGSAVELKKRFPELELIQTSKNLGFSGGANVGIRHALKQGADYMILLNNDTIVAPDFARELIKAAEADPAAGILCSKVYFHDRPDTIWYAGAAFNAWLGWGRHRGFGQRDTGQFGSTEETQRPCACAMLVTRRLCEEAGLFDEDYFCYHEDTDLGLRAKKAGFKILYVPASKVWHKVSRAGGGFGSAKPLYYTVRNILRCLDKNCPASLPQRFFRNAAVIGTNIIGLFTMEVTKADGFKNIFKGFVDYTKGRFGEKKP